MLAGESRHFLGFKGKDCNTLSQMSLQMALPKFHNHEVEEKNENLGFWIPESSDLIATPLMSVLVLIVTQTASHFRPQGKLVLKHHCWVGISFTLRLSSGGTSGIVCPVTPCKPSLPESRKMYNCSVPYGYSYFPSLNRVSSPLAS